MLHPIGYCTESLGETNFMMAMDLIIQQSSFGSLGTTALFYSASLPI
jgi:hypothetical protein